MLRPSRINYETLLFGAQQSLLGRDVPIQIVQSVQSCVCSPMQVSWRKRIANSIRIYTPTIRISKYNNIASLLYTYFFEYPKYRLNVSDPPHDLSATRCWTLSGNQYNKQINLRWTHYTFSHMPQNKDVIISANLPRIYTSSSSERIFSVFSAVRWWMRISTWLFDWHQHHSW